MKFGTIIPTIALFTGVFSTEVALFPKTSASLKAPQDFEQLESIIRPAFTSCDTKANILAISQGGSSLRENIPKLSDYSTFEIKEEVEEKKLSDAFKKFALECKEKVEHFDSVASASVINNGYFIVESSKDEASFVKFLDSALAKDSNIILVRADLTESQKASGLKSSKKHKHPKVPVSDPLLSWISFELVMCLMVVLFLVSVLLIAISWLASIEGPTQMDSGNKKLN